jgi:hypothetical protein
MRYVMRPNQDLDIDTEVIRVPKNLYNATSGPVAIVAEIENFGIHDHAFQILYRLHSDLMSTNTMHFRLRRRELHTFWNFDPLLDAIVMRNHEAPATPDAKYTDHGRMCAPQYLRDIAMGTSIGLDPQNANRHAVAMHRALRRFFADVNIAAQACDWLVWNHESVAIAMHAESPRNQGRFSRR